jgi:hypothetical protein
VGYRGSSKLEGFTDLISAVMSYAGVCVCAQHVMGEGDWGGMGQEGELCALLSNDHVH